VLPLLGGGTAGGALVVLREWEDGVLGDGAAGVGAAWSCGGSTGGATGGAGVAVAEDAAGALAAGELGTPIEIGGDSTLLGVEDDVGPVADTPLGPEEEVSEGPLDPVAFALFAASRLAIIGWM